MSHVSHANSRDARILVIDDRQVNISLLEDILTEAGYSNIQGSTDSRNIRALFHHTNPDLILLDLHMPFLNGFEVMGIISELKPQGAWLPILVLTADATPETKRAALKTGATDFLSKPFDPIEVVLRVENLIQARLLHLRLDNVAELLAEKLCHTSTALEGSYLELIQRLSLAAEYKDDDTGLHTRRVGEFTGKLARMLGLTDYEARLIALAAPLHDVGKLAIPDSILLKPSQLTVREFKTIKTHTTIGAKLLAGIDHPLLKCASTIALYHHERWDGTGYEGLKGDAIPLEARIVSVADVLDVLIHDRPYRRAWSVEDAITEIKLQSGTQFDPQVVEVFAAGGFVGTVENLGMELQSLLAAVKQWPGTPDLQMTNEVLSVLPEAVEP
jgi:putative two-component system response regulator